MIPRGSIPSHIHATTATRAPTTKRKRGKGTIQYRVLPSGAERWRARYMAHGSSRAGPWREEREEAVRDLARVRPVRRVPKCPCGCGTPKGFCVAHRDLLQRIRDEFQAAEGFRSTGHTAPFR
jgi:hypothetical protein